MKASSLWLRALLVGVFVGAMAACALDQLNGLVNETRTELKAAQADLDKARADLDARAKAGQDVAAPTKVADAVGKLIEAGTTAADSLDAAVTDIESVPDAVDDTTAVVSQFIPPEWRWAVLLGGTTLAALIRAANGRRAARKIVVAIEAAKSNTNQIDFNNPATVATLDSMGRAAKRIVDEAQGTVNKLPI